MSNLKYDMGNYEKGFTGKRTEDAEGERKQMKKKDLLGMEVNVEDNFWVLAKYVVETQEDEMYHEDGSFSSAYTYLKYSDNGTGWYRFYEKNKIRKA